LDALNLRVEFLAQDFIALGSPLLLGGKSKTLKTSLLLYVSVCLAHALSIFGRYRVPRPAPVTILSGESGLPVIQETLRRIRRALNVQPNGQIHISTDLPDLTSSFVRQGRSLEQLRGHLQRHASKLVVFDPAYLMLEGDDAGNVFKQGGRLRPLAELGDELQATIALVHHLKKSSGQELAIPTLEDFAFAGFAEFAAQWILIGRREPYEDGSGHHELWLRYGGRAGHEGLLGVDIRERAPISTTSDGRRIWQVTAQPAPEAEASRQRSREEQRRATQAQRRADQLAEDGEQIMQALRRRPADDSGWHIKTELRNRTGLSTQRTTAALQDLLDRGAIETLPRAVLSGANRCDGYRLNEGRNLAPG
jgi:hypothetical protein